MKLSLQFSIIFNYVDSDYDAKELTEFIENEFKIIETQGT